jgi:hypothetical protein
MTTLVSTSRAGTPVTVRRLRAGDRVRVKNVDEILATLDADGRVDGLPFMPEMLTLVGRTFTVEAVTHRTCDTIKSTGTSGTTRRLERAVHLRGVRCDGSGHGGCQALCLIFWKEDWLEKLATGAATDTGETGHDRPGPQADPAIDVPPVIEAASQREGSTEAKPLYSCQATELVRATTFVSARDPRMWIADVRSRNATVRAAIGGFAVLALGNLRKRTAGLPAPLRVRSRRIWPVLTPTGEKREYTPQNLRPGELVEVRPREEIEAILDLDDARGPRFDPGMLLDCGRRARVLARINRIIDERSGRMLKLRDCILLEDVWCDGNHRALCRRKIYTFWRDEWLRRVETESPPSDEARGLVGST